MSTSEENGQTQLTRKQLREIRLTGSTPVITEEDAAAAAAQPTTVLPRAAEPVQIAPTPPVEQPTPDAPLTRRQMRALERAREEATAHQDVAAVEDATIKDASVDEKADDESVVGDDAAGSAPVEELVSGVPAFDPRPVSAPRFDASEALGTDADDDDAEPLQVDQAQVAAIFGSPVDEAPVPLAGEVADVAEEEGVDAAVGEAVSAESAATPPASSGPAGAEADADTAERPMVGAAFGLGVKEKHNDLSSKAVFDELIEGDTSTSQHGASTALIFTPSPGASSLSGPIASTGEMLVTGTYALPDGLGSQGHARGAADGREIDAVLLDGELAPSSSPTPIAASSAISTSRPAGEVIRPPAPDKGNKLMLTLAVVAGSLAIVLAATLVIAFTTGVFG